MAHCCNAFGYSLVLQKAFYKSKQPCCFSGYKTFINFNLGQTMFLRICATKNNNISMDPIKLDTFRISLHFDEFTDGMRWIFFFCFISACISVYQRMSKIRGTSKYLQCLRCVENLFARKTLKLLNKHLNSCIDFPICRWIDVFIKSQFKFIIQKWYFGIKNGLKV